MSRLSFVLPLQVHSAGRESDTSATAEFEQLSEAQ